MRKLFLILSLLLLIGISIATWLFLFQKTQDVNRDKHYQLLSTINDLKRVDIKLTLDIILLRLASDNNYDRLRKTLKILKTHKKELDNFNIKEVYETVLDVDDLSQLNFYRPNEKKKYNQVFKKRMNLVKKFKRSNGVLINSINYIPIATEELLETLRKAKKSTEFKQTIHQILLSTLIYIQHSNQENLEHLNTVLSKFDTQRLKFQSENIQTASDTLNLHAKTIINYKIAVEKLLKEISVASAGNVLDELARYYTSLNEKQLEKVANFRFILVVFSAVLLLMLTLAGLYIWYNYRKLQVINHSLEERVEMRTNNLSKTLEKLKESQSHLVQSEKMASLGQMVAGVAHEINTPLGYVKSNVELIQEMMADITEYTTDTTILVSYMNKDEIDEQEINNKMIALKEQSALFQPNESVIDDVNGFIQESLAGLSSINELVMSLKNFSRVDKATMDHVDIHQCINNTLLVAKNKLKDSVLVKKQYSADLPLIKCSPSQINQVILNLIVNAEQAMKNDDEIGTITIRTMIEDHYLLIKIMDNGKGMSEDILEHIFDPFYTTKPVGEGTGLGLSISYKIIQEHQGKLLVSSIEGKGTQFTIALPLNAENEE